MVREHCDTLQRVQLTPTAAALAAFCFYDKKMNDGRDLNANYIRFLIVTFWLKIVTEIVPNEQRHSTHFRARCSECGVRKWCAHNVPLS